MAISRKKKEQLVAQYVDMFSRSQAAILTDYRGLTVADMARLRQKVREVGGSYHVVKNTLARLALKQLGLPVPEGLMEGPTAVGFCYQEAPPVAKVLVNFAKEFKTFAIKGGLLGDRTLSADEIEALAELPSREVLLARVLGTIQAPAGRVAGALAESIRQILRLLQARVEQLEKQASQA